MIDRIGYALSMAWRYRNQLKAYREEASLQSESVLNCDPVLLKTQGIKIIALDLDGVLTPYGVVPLRLEIERWLQFCVEVFGEGKVFILSNKPTLERVHYFSEHFKSVRFILPSRKKPYPEGIQQILQQTHVDPKELLVVDDRLLTGILAAIIAKTSGCYITKPMVSWVDHPLPELFFMGLRKVERFFI